jgi:hypothetical protein
MMLNGVNAPQPPRATADAEQCNFAHNTPATLLRTSTIVGIDRGVEILATYSGLYDDYVFQEHSIFY